MAKRKGLLPLYDAFAVPPDYAGKWADEFHRMVARKYLAGMTGGHTSVGPGATAEALVREHLAIDWCKDRGIYRAMNRFDAKFCWWKWKHLEDVITGWRCAVAKAYYDRFSPCPYKAEI